MTDLRPPKAAEAANAARRTCGEAKRPEAAPAIEAQEYHTNGHCK
jgi:hypothetical protein